MLINKSQAFLVLLVVCNLRSTTPTLEQRQALSIFRSSNCTGDPVDTFTNHGSFITNYNATLIGMDINSFSVFGIWDITYNWTDPHLSKQPISKRVVRYSETINGTCLSEFLSRDKSLISFQPLGDEYQNDSSVLFLYNTSNFDGIPLKITAANTLYINTTYKSYFFMGSKHQWISYEFPNYKGAFHKLVPNRNVTKRGWGFTLHSGNESIWIRSIRRLPNASSRNQASNYALNCFIFVLFISKYLAV